MIFPSPKFSLRCVAVAIHSDWLTPFRHQRTQRGQSTQQDLYVFTYTERQVVQAHECRRACKCARYWNGLFYTKSTSTLRHYMCTSVAGKETTDLEGGSLRDVWNSWLVVIIVQQKWWRTASYEVNNNSINNNVRTHFIAYFFNYDFFSCNSQHQCTWQQQWQIIVKMHMIGQYFATVRMTCWFVLCNVRTCK